MELIAMVLEEIGWVDDGTGNYIETFPNDKLDDFGKHMVTVLQTGSIFLTRAQIVPDLEGLYVIYKPTPAPEQRPRRLSVSAVNTLYPDFGST